MSAAETSVIGRSVRRADGAAKVRGEAVFGFDYAEPRMLHARLVRSPLAAGRITRLDTSRAERMPGVVAVATAADCPNLSGWIVKDQPLFAGEAVRYVGEPIAAVAAETVGQALAAAAAVELELEATDPVLDPEAALAEGASILHPGWESYGALVPGPRSGNLAWESTLVQGDVEAGFAGADLVLEGEYRAPRQHQVPLEPHCAVARYEAGRYVIHTPSQYPFLVRDRVAEFLGVRQSAVRVVCTTVGGGFGGKLDALLEPYCALLARKAGRPVRLLNFRAEEFETAGPRENGVVRVKAGVTKTGEILALEVEAIMDAGAYAGETVGVASAMPLIAGATYRVGAARFVARVAYTNTAPTAAYRGVMGPYLVFALERHLDRIAGELRLDRRELRLRNVYRPGERMPNGQELPDAAFLDAFEKVEEIAPWAEVSVRRPNRGVGIAALGWLTNPMPGGATVKLNEDGTVTVITAAAEIGTGAVTTGLVQIAAEELGVRPEDVVILDADTDAASYDAGAQGSRTTFNVGNAIREAAGVVRQQILATAAGLLEADAADLELAEGTVRVAGAPERAVPLFAVALTALWTAGPIQGSGRYISPPVPFDQGCMTGAFFTTLNATTYHVHLAEVEVDPATGQVRILRYVVAQDVGRAINPAAIMGQIEGGVAQGVGYALYEGLQLEGGRCVNGDMESYRVPTALEAPPVEAVILEVPSPHGPFGAKGAAEPPIVPVAAVIANAVADAVGRPFDTLPITPFAVHAALRGDTRGGSA